MAVVNLTNRFVDIAIYKIVCKSSFDMRLTDSFPSVIFLALKEN